jgi:hypothetical protein
MRRAAATIGKNLAPEDEEFFPSHDRPDEMMPRATRLGDLFHRRANASTRRQTTFTAQERNSVP